MHTLLHPARPKYKGGNVKQAFFPSFSPLSFPFPTDRQRAASPYARSSPMQSQGEKGELALSEWMEKHMWESLLYIFVALYPPYSLS